MPENIIEELNELLDLTQANLDAIEQIPHPMAEEIHAKIFELGPNPLKLKKNKAA